jgi:hypothetical protein
MPDDPPPKPTRIDHFLVRIGLARFVESAVAREVRLRRLVAAAAVAALSDAPNDRADLDRPRAKATRHLEKRMRAVKGHNDLPTEQDWQDYLARLDGALKMSRALTDFIYDKTQPPQ